MTDYNGAAVLTETYGATGAVVLILFFVFIVIFIVKDILKPDNKQSKAK